MKIIPLFDRVVIQQLDAQEQTKGGILLPSSMQEKPQLAKVVFVGGGEDSNGNPINMLVKPGDTIFYSKYSGMEYKFGNETFTIIRQTDILAILED